MRIKILASVKEQSPTTGPYRTVDIIERPNPYARGDHTHYGEVLLVLPTEISASENIGQVVVVRLDPKALGVWCDDTVMDRPPMSYSIVEFIPIRANTDSWGDDPPITGPYTILNAEGLTIENVSPLINDRTFALWKNDCFMSRGMAESLESVKFAIVHRYSSSVERDDKLAQRSGELLDSAASCLSLIRPTRPERATRVRGLIKSDGSFDPQGFSAREDLADVPEIQKLFLVRETDINELISVLPEFMQLYQKDADGKLKDDYEPLRMAVQLYSEAYALSYWKARHILWWSAIEALYGNCETAAIARMYAFFGNKSLIDGSRLPIYAKGDVPSFFPATEKSLHTLGQMVPVLYAVRNFSAHGQKVPDLHFERIHHPFGQDVIGIEALAEAATFIIRTTITEILKRGWRQRFKDRDTREEFWLYEYGLDKKQSKKRLAQLEAALSGGLALGAKRRT